MIGEDEGFEIVCLVIVIEVGVFFIGFVGGCVFLCVKIVFKCCVYDGWGFCWEG